MQTHARFLVAAAACGAVLAAVAVAQSPPAKPRSLPAALPASFAAPQKIDPTLRGRTGQVEVVVRLGDAPLLVAAGENARREGSALDERAQRQYARTLSERQSAVLAQLHALGGREIARLRVALDAVIVAIDATQLESVAAIPTVTAVNSVGRYRKALGATVPYVGAAAVQAAGTTGAGVRIAVLDSGIDYTHANLGGPGTAAAYTAAYGANAADPRNTTRDGLFPTAKVVDGYDFLGETWPTDPQRRPDPDPIDAEGHGTHVADIAAGKGGVAPGAALLAVKVCSAVNFQCDGAALLQGMEFALDPNGDGSIADAVDVINLSVGADYGQREDDLAAAATNAVRAGVVVVASAGNAGDRPFIVSSPATARGVIAVGQSQAPGAVAVGLKVTAPASLAGVYRNTALLDWAPVGNGFAGPVVFAGTACPGDGVPALAGRVVLVERGGCDVSEKIDRAAAGGAIAVLVGLVAPGDAITFSRGIGTRVVPSLVITQATSGAIQAALQQGLAVQVEAGADTTLPLVRSLVSTSSRGPALGTGVLKPDLVAPGTSVSAIAGSGTGTEPFSGASGAAPMVAGAAALLLEKYPRRSPTEIKAVLVNTGETALRTNPALLGDELAPVARIGGGELRADRAVGSTTAAWDTRTRAGSLSFGYRPLAQKQVFEREVRVRNYSRQARAYRITPSFRYANDAASGAVRVDAPQWLHVRGRGTETFTVRVTIDPARLPFWSVNAGAGGGDGRALQAVEFDGYLQITDAADTVRLPWHALPHRAADVDADSHVRLRSGTGTLQLRNASAVLDGSLGVFALTGTSPRIPRAEFPGAGDEFTINDLRAVGVRLVAEGGVDYAQFAVNTYTRRTHPAYPGAFNVRIDANRDGVLDYVIFTAEIDGFATTGQTGVFVFDTKTQTSRALFYVDANFESRNVILTVPADWIGLTRSTKFDFSVVALDNYFTQSITDEIGTMTMTLGTPRFVLPGLPLDFAVQARAQPRVDVAAVPGGAAASPSQSGLLLMYRDAATSREADVVRVR